MNEVDKFYESNTRPADFAKAYMNHLHEIMDRLDYEAIGQTIELFIEAREKGQQIFFIGNGGSAATASHFANDIGVGTRTQGKHFKAISLADNNAILTAIGNDYGYEDIFLKQLEILMNPGDIVLAISASGNSPNIISAINYANDNGAKTIGLSGFEGGKLRELSQVSVHIPTDKGEYGPVEDFHMIIDHLINNYLARFVKSEL